MSTTEVEDSITEGRPTRALTVTMTGPNLRLSDLRWLVARCEGLPDTAKVRIDGARQGAAPNDFSYERIVVSEPAAG